jgi:hypothetical protein
MAVHADKCEPVSAKFNVAELELTFDLRYLAIDAIVTRL